jgi:hypothetical protein
MRAGPWSRHRAFPRQQRSAAGYAVVVTRAAVRAAQTQQSGSQRSPDAICPASRLAIWLDFARIEPDTDTDKYKSLLAIHTQGGKDNSLKQQPQAVVPSLAGII